MEIALVRKGSGLKEMSEKAVLAARQNSVGKYPGNRKSLFGNHEGAGYLLMFMPKKIKTAVSPESIIYNNSELPR